MQTVTQHGHPYVVVSSPGMEDMAASVIQIITQKWNVVLPHHRLEFKVFANGEVLPRVPETVRRQHVFFFHSMQHPSPNDALIRLLLANDAMGRASVGGITPVLPYLTYLRQDRKDKPRVPISARVIADLIETNRAVERIITVDMHADQAQGFFKIPVDNLTTVGLFARHLSGRLNGDFSNVMVVSPDFGGVVRARRFAKKLGGLPVGIFEKTRPSANVSEVVSVIGDPVQGKRIVIYDDMIDTGGTIRGVVKALYALGVAEVMVVGTHGIFSAGAEEHFSRAGFPVWVTNSIPRMPSYHDTHAAWLTTVALDELLANAVYQASLVGGSVSTLST